MNKDYNLFMELVRRLYYFHNGNLDCQFLLLAYPSEAKRLLKANIIKPYSKEQARTCNWYSLTSNAKELFKKHINFNVRISEKINYELFNNNKSFNQSIEKHFKALFVELNKIKQI